MANMDTHDVLADQETCTFAHKEIFTDGKLVAVIWVEFDLKLMIIFYDERLSEFDLDVNINAYFEFLELAGIDQHNAIAYSADQLRSVSVSNPLDAD